MDNKSFKIFKKLLNRAKAKSDFKILHRDNVTFMTILKDFFIKNVQPIYGNQTMILNKIKEGKDRTCEFLCQNENPVGFIIYKNHLNNEFMDLGIENGFELKTISVLNNNKKDSGVFLCNLLHQAAKRAIAMKAICILGTVSDQRSEVLKLMCRLGFKIVKTFPGKYIPNVDEHLLCHSSLDKLLEISDFNQIEQNQEDYFVAT